MFRVVTWNVHGARDGNGASFDLGRYLRAEDPDLVCLQEFDFDSVAGVGPQSLGNLLGLHHVASWPLEPSVHTTGGRMGLVVASRWPHLRVSRLLANNPGLTQVAGNRTLVSHDKGALVVDVKISERLLAFSGLHLLPFRFFDEVVDVEVQELLTWIELRARIMKSRENFHHIIAGDFNFSLHEGPAVGEQAHPPLNLSLKGATRTSGASHDDVLHTSGLLLENVEMRLTPSDHFLCICDFSISEGSW